MAVLFLDYFVNDTAKQNTKIGDIISKIFRKIVFELKG